MSYFSTDGAGIEYAILAPTTPPESTRASAQIRRPPRGTIIWGGGKQAQAKALGACCSDCAQGGLGAILGEMSSTLSRIGAGPPPPPPPPGTVPLPPGAIPPPGMYPAAGGGMSPIVKLALLAGVGVGGFLLIRKLRARKAV